MGESGGSCRREGPSALSVITVTFNPDIGRLAQQLACLPAAAAVVVVDNASDVEQRDAIRHTVAARPGSRLLQNACNRGLATALNQGASLAMEAEPERWLLLYLDQDSVPCAGSVETLAREFDRLAGLGLPVGCVGPALIDEDTQLEHGFHCISGWRWIRRYTRDTGSAPFECANLNGSGTVVACSLVKTLGGLEDGFFIDHVDTEWAFRVQAHGLKLYAVPSAFMRHRMGSKGIRYWCFGWRVWPWRTAGRHFYLFRNAMRLLGRRYVPLVWKLWAVPKLALTLLLHALADPDRAAQLRAMINGLRAGLGRDPARKRR